MKIIGYEYAIKFDCFNSWSGPFKTEEKAKMDAEWTKMTDDRAKNSGYKILRRPILEWEEYK